MRLPRSGIETTTTSLQLIVVSIILAVLAHLSQDYSYLLASTSLTAYLAYSYIGFSRKLNVLKTTLLLSATTERRRVPVGRPIKMSVAVMNPVNAPIRVLGLECKVSSPTIKVVDQEPWRAKLLPKQRFVFQQELMTLTGGKLGIDSIALRISDQRGLFNSLVRFPLEASVEVYPTTLPRKGLTPMALYGGGAHRQMTSPTGTEYAGTRQYEPGDDVHRIDWKATARLTKLMVKEFHAETNIPIVIMLDVGEGMNRPAYVGTRLDEAAAVAYLLSEIAIARGDPVSLIPYSEDNVHSYMEPSSRTTQPARIQSLLLQLGHRLEESEQPEPRRTRTLRTIHQALKQLEVLKGQKESAWFSEKLLSFFRQFRTVFFKKLQGQGAYRAFTVISTRQGTPSLIVVLTDLQSQLDGLIEGARVAQRKGHRVVAVQICAPWRTRLNLEECYLDYRKNRKMLAEVTANDVSTIDAEPEAVIDELNREMSRARLLRFPHPLG